MSGFTFDFTKDHLKEMIGKNAYLDYWWDAFHLTEKREEAMMWSVICGNGFWKITWDDKSGPGMKVMLNPDGQPIVDPLVRYYFDQKLAEAGIDSSEFERRIYQGEIRVDVMSPFDVLLDDYCCDM